MSEQPKLYTVLRESPFFSLRDPRAPGDVSYPAVGDKVSLSEGGAEHLMREGWVEPVHELAEPTPPRPRIKKATRDDKAEVN